MTKEAAAAVQVALRIRPLTERDRAQPRFANLSNDDVLKIHEKTVHVVPHNKLFTFDYVFGTDSRQSQVFEALGTKLINKFTEGYNVTILAYGQTSSGKTYTMGTAQHQSGRHNMEQEGIVPRAMALLFDTLTAGGSTLVSDRPVTPAPSLSSSTDNTAGTRLRPPSRASHHARSSQHQSNNNNNNGRKYSVKVSFVEIYNEELNDLLNSAPANERPPVTIREDAKGHIYWTGVKEVPVNNTDDVLFNLEQGTRNRATGATDMNEKSSRSHAIFSVSLRQEKWVPRGGKGSRDSEWMITSSKFHFVDLAGSERLKRTAAEGDRRKEGININAGLLALGNVISALGDPSKRSTHIPYRDSKLTRLLQDSLGGSATTLMIACASPAENNLSETLNTLQYANRARNIKNRAEKNEVEEWMTSDNIELLRSMIGRLKSEVRSLKSGSLSSSGSTVVDHGIPTSNAGDLDQVFQEQRLVIADLQRQVEELDGEASVTRERNRVVEAELNRLRKLDAVRKKESELRQQNNSNYDFQHLVEPVIEEYEKSIAALESQLAMARAALNHSDIGFDEQRQKLEQCELMLETQDQTVVDLRSRLNKLQERESNNEAYIDELEAKLVQSTKDARRDQELLNELKTRIMRFKETDDNTEQYIFDLEQRLATSEAERQTLQETVEQVEKRLADRDSTINQLREQLAKAEDIDAQKMMLKEIDDLELKCTTLERERDQLKAEVDQMIVAQKEQEQKQQKQLSIPPPQSPLPTSSSSSKSIQEEQLEREAAAAKRRYADEHETLESKGALAVKHAEERLQAEAAKVAALEQNLRELQGDHHEMLKEHDEVLLRYQEALDQLELLQQPDHSMDALSKEMSRAKEEAEIKVRDEQLRQIKDLEAELAELEAREAQVAQELKATVARHAVDQGVLQQDLGASKDALATSQAALEAKQAELDQTKERLADLHQYVADLEAQHAAELNQSKMQFDTLQTRLDETVAELGRCKALLTTQADETAKWEKQLADTQAEMERHVASKVQEGERLVALQKQLSETQADLERHKGLLESQSAEAASQVAALQQKLADAQADLGNHRQLLDAKTVEGAAVLESLSEKLRSTQTELESHKHAKTNLEKLLGDALAELDSHKQLLEAGNKDIAKRLADTQAELDRHKSLIDAVRLENTQLKENITHLEEERDILLSKSGSGNDQELQHELAETKAELVRHRQLLNDTQLHENQHIAALEQRLKDTQAELERSTADNTRASVLKQRLQDTEEEAERYKGANDQLSLLQQRYAEVQDELERSTTSNSASTAALKQQLVDAQKELERYKDNKMTTSSQLSDLQQRLAATQAELDRLSTTDEAATHASSMAALKQQLTETLDELERQKHMAEKGKTDLTTLQQQSLATMQAQLEEYKETQAELAKTQARVMELEGLLSVVPSQGPDDALHERLAEAEAALARRDREMSVLQERVEQLERLGGPGEEDAHRAALALKDKAISDLQQDLEALEEALAQTEEQQKKAEHEHLALLDDVTLENDQLAARIKELERVHETDQSERQALEERIKQLTAELEQEQKHRALPPSPKVDYQQEHQAQVEALQEQLELAQATNIEKDGHLRSLRSQVETHARTITELGDRLEKAEFTSKVHSQNGSGDDDEIAKLYVERIEVLEQKTKVLEEENKEYQTLSEELEAEVSRLIKKEEQDAMASEAAIAAAVDAAEKEIAAVRAEKSQVEERISTLEAQLQALEQTPQNADGQLADTQAKLADAQRQAQVEKAAREKAERTLASLESQLEELISKKSKFMCF